MPGCDIALGLDAYRRRAVDDAGDTAAAVAGRDDDPDLVGGRAVNRAYLRYRLDLVQDVHREAVGHHDHERVAGADRLSRRDGGASQLGSLPDLRTSRAPE